MSVLRTAVVPEIEERLVNVYGKMRKKLETDHVELESKNGENTLKTRSSKSSVIKTNRTS
jgi:hypothetical protein